MLAESGPVPQMLAESGQVPQMLSESGPVPHQIRAGSSPDTGRFPTSSQPPCRHASDSSFSQDSGALHTTTHLSLSYLSLSLSASSSSHFSLSSLPLSLSSLPLSLS